MKTLYAIYGKLGRNLTSDECTLCRDYAEVAVGAVGYLWSMPINRQYQLSNWDRFATRPNKISLLIFIQWAHSNLSTTGLNRLDESIKNNRWLFSKTNLQLMHPCVQGFLIHRSLDYLLPDPMLSNWLTDKDSNPMIDQDFERSQQLINAQPWRLGITSIAVEHFMHDFEEKMRSAPNVNVLEATDMSHMPKTNASITEFDGDGGLPLNVRNDTNTSIVECKYGEPVFRPKVDSLPKNLTALQLKDQKTKRGNARNRDTTMRPPPHLRDGYKGNF
jgi:hypothetical protein